MGRGSAFLAGFEEIGVGLAAAAVGAVGFGEEVAVVGFVDEIAPGVVVAAGVVDFLILFFDFGLIAIDLEEDGGGAEVAEAGHIPGLIGEHIGDISVIAGGFAGEFAGGGAEGLEGGGVVAGQEGGGSGEVAVELLEGGVAAEGEAAVLGGGGSGGRGGRRFRSDRFFHAREDRGWVYAKTEVFLASC
jgi:hypothetical protein